MTIMDILKRLMCCACMKNQTNEAGAITDEKVNISIKTTCCRRTKIININVSNDPESLKEVKDIIDRLEMKARVMSRQNSGSL
jgi:hypothetical protein